MSTDSITQTPMIDLNDGRSIPQLGFGTYKIEDDKDAEQAVKKAVEIGYQLVDTAAVYKNEKGVGAGLQGKDDIWLTTKVWNESQGYDRALKAFDKCLARLGRDSVDLVLIHWPCPDDNLYVDTWKAFIEQAADLVAAGGLPARQAADRIVAALRRVEALTDKLFRELLLLRRR